MRGGLELADRDGVDGARTRRLVTALGRGPMALCYYVRDREDLLRGSDELLNA